MPRKKRSVEEEKGVIVTSRKFDTVFAQRLSALIKEKRKEFDNIDPYTKELTGVTSGKKELAERFGVTVRVIELWEAQKSRPDIDLLESIAKCFGITVDYLIGKSDDPSSTHEAGAVMEKYGFSKKAIDGLNSLQSGDFSDRATLVFLNAIMEQIKSPAHMPILINHSVDYIIGAHEHLLKQEEIRKQIDAGFSFFGLELLENEELERKTYRLKEDFFHLIRNLAMDDELRNQIKGIYENCNRALPDYKNERFAEFEEKLLDLNAKIKLSVHHKEADSSEDDNKK